MPLIERIELNKLRIGVWSITEKLEVLSKLVSPIHHDTEIRNEGRNLQWLACRAALSEIIANPESKIHKDEFGKPHIIGPEHISLSHTHKYAAAVSSNKPVGIDIEEITPRIERITRRFLHEAEIDFLRPKDKLTMLYLIWCAKEAMYKLYGRKAVDFAKDIRVLPFELDGNQIFDVEFRKEDLGHYRAQYRLFDKHALVWIEGI